MLLLPLKQLFNITGSFFKTCLFTFNVLQDYITHNYHFPLRVNRVKIYGQSTDKLMEYL